MSDLTDPMVVLENQTEMDSGCSWVHSGALQKGCLPSGRTELQRGSQLTAACFRMLARQRDCCCWTHQSDSLRRMACFQMQLRLQENY